MGLRVTHSSDVNMACDHVGCASSFHKTWVNDVGHCLILARNEGWYIGTPESDDPDRPTLTFCPTHHSKEESNAAV